MAVAEWKGDETRPAHKRQKCRLFDARKRRPFSAGAKERLFVVDLFPHVRPNRFRVAWFCRRNSTGCRPSLGITKGRVPPIRSVHWPKMTAFLIFGQWALEARTRRILCCHVWRAVFFSTDFVSLGANFTVNERRGTKKDGKPKS